MTRACTKPRACTRVNPFPSPGYFRARPVHLAAPSVRRCGPQARAQEGPAGVPGPPGPGLDGPGSPVTKRSTFCHVLSRLDKNEHKTTFIAAGSLSGQLSYSLHNCSTYSPCVPLEHFPPALHCPERDRGVPAQTVGAAARACAREPARRSGRAEAMAWVRLAEATVRRDKMTALLFYFFVRNGQKPH